MQRERVLLLLVAVLLLLLLLRQCGGEVLRGCPSGAHRVVSFDSELLPPSNISASSEDSPGFIDDYLVHRSNVPARLWCSEPGALPLNSLPERPLLLINVTFTRTVLVTHFVSAGFSNAFVSLFTVVYAAHGGNYALYRNRDTQSAEFEVAAIDTVLTLAPPLSADRLQLHVVNAVIGSTGRVCWHLAMLGCPLEEATSVGTTPTTSSTILVSQATQTPQATPTCLQRELVVTDYRLVVLIVPVALATVVLVASVVAVGVCACAVQRRKGDRRDKATRISRKFSSKCPQQTPTQADANCGDPPRLNRERAAGERHSLCPTTSSSLGVPLELVSLAHSSSSYQSSEAAQMTVTSECLPQLLGNAGGERTGSSSDSDSMVDNPVYSIPFQFHTGFPIPRQKPSIRMASNECYEVSCDSEQVLSDFHSQRSHSSMN